MLLLESIILRSNFISLSSCCSNLHLCPTFQHLNKEGKSWSKHKEVMRSQPHISRAISKVLTKRHRDPESSKNLSGLPHSIGLLESKFGAVKEVKHVGK